MCVVLLPSVLVKSLPTPLNGRVIMFSDRRRVAGSCALPGVLTKLRTVPLIRFCNLCDSGDSGHRRKWLPGAR